MGNFDVVLEKIGPFGRYQVTYWILIGLAIAPGGIQHMANIYVMATPPFSCNVPELSNLDIAEQMNITTPPGEWGANEAACQIRDLNYSEALTAYLNNQELPTSNGSVIKCDDWVYDYSKYGTTAVTEWDLVCSRSWLTDVAQSLYMVGVLLGALLFGHISDSHGRRITLCLSMTGLLVSGTLAAVMPEVWSHILMRMCAGVCASGSFLVSCVLATELIGIKRRALPGITITVFFNIGALFLTAVAYFARNFQHTMLIVGILSVVFMSYWCILPESPRWLLTKGKVSEAKKELSRAARMNGVTVDVDELVDGFLEMDDNDNVKLPGTTYTASDLFRTPVIRKRSVLVLFIWFVSVGEYFGISLLYRELILDIYLNSVVMLLLEATLVLFLAAAIHRLSRRIILTSLLIIGGISLLISVFLFNRYPVFHIGLITLGRLSSAVIISIMYAYTSEIFPTVVRNVALGAGSTMGHIAAVIAPFNNELRVVWEPLPCLVYGVFSLVSGLSALFLPETLDQPLSDTIEETECEHGKTTGTDWLERTNREMSETKGLLETSSSEPGRN